MVSHRNLLPHLRSFDKGNEKHILVKAPNPRRNNDSDSVTMPTSFMTGLIVGKRFYKKVMTREADDGNGWAVKSIARLQNT
ncbi:BnaC05g09960D [Brassica napus]|uniref:BnaC05g09960D protein n=1 Tax=Brassica napus TaxID=3708 RepID=A0A078HDE8_BRANA|nr:BnaC05g09960D [Brassica napus]